MNPYNYPINEFSPSGRLTQVDYASKAASHRNTAVGIVISTGVVIATKAVAESPLLVASSTNSVFRLDNNVVAAFVGVSGDARPLANGATQKVVQRRLEFGESPSIEYVANVIVNQMAKATMQATSRPFGVSVLVGGLDESTPKLFRINTQAENVGVKAAAVGKDADRAQAYLEENYADDLDEAGAVGLAIKSLLQTGTLVAEDVEITVIKAGKGYSTYSLTEKRDAIESIV